MTWKLEPKKNFATWADAEAFINQLGLQPSDCETFVDKDGTYAVVYWVQPNP